MNGTSITDAADSSPVPCPPLSWLAAMRKTRSVPRPVFATAALLATYADRDGTNARPGSLRLAEDTAPAAGESTVNKHLDWLRRNGWLHVAVRASGPGRGKTGPGRAAVLWLTLPAAAAKTPLTDEQSFAKTPLTPMENTAHSAPKTPLTGERLPDQVTPEKEKTPDPPPPPLPATVTPITGRVVKRAGGSPLISLLQSHLPALTDDQAAAYIGWLMEKGWRSPAAAIRQDITDGILENRLKTWEDSTLSTADKRTRQGLRLAEKYAQQEQAADILRQRTKLDPDDIPGFMSWLAGRGINRLTEYITNRDDTELKALTSRYSYETYAPW